MSTFENLNSEYLQEISIQNIQKMISDYENNSDFIFDLDGNNDNLSTNEEHILKQLEKYGNIIDGLKTLLSLTKDAQNNLISLNGNLDGFGNGFQIPNIEQNSGTLSEKEINNNLDLLITIDNIEEKGVSFIFNEIGKLGINIEKYINYLLNPNNISKLNIIVENGIFKFGDICLSPHVENSLKTTYIEINNTALFNSFSLLYDKNGKQLNDDIIDNILNSSKCKPFKLINLLGEVYKKNGEQLSNSEIKELLNGTINLKKEKIELSVYKLLKEYNLELHSFPNLSESEIKKILLQKNIPVKKYDILVQSLLEYDNIKTNKLNLVNKDSDYIGLLSKSSNLDKDTSAFLTANISLINEIQKDKYLVLLKNLGIVDDTISEIKIDENTLKDITNKLELELLKNPNNREVTKLLNLLKALNYNTVILEKKYNIFNKDIFLLNNKKNNISGIEYVNFQGKTKNNEKEYISHNNGYQLLGADGSIIKGLIISEEEKKITMGNPEALENIINTYEQLKELNLLFVWNFRKDLIQTMNQVKGTSGININDNNFINKIEFHKLLNFILEVIGEKVDSNSIDGTINKIKLLNGGGMLNNNKSIYSGLSIIGQRFEKLGYINHGGNSFDTKNKTNLLNYKSILNK